jgi:magnesium-transporting ATPase (P-type)
MDGKEILGHIAGLKDNVRQYLETKISYYGILAFEKAVKLLSMIMANVVAITLLMLAMLFLSGAAALTIGELLNSYVFGMLVVGGFYLLLSLFFIARRKSIFGRLAIKILFKIFIDEDEQK